MDVVLADWVFGYGSLIWDPEVDFEEESLARVHGYHRAFCIRSTLYRGTPERPGVVLGLDRGGSCVGVAYRLRHATRRESITRLYDREMRNRIYQPTLVSVTLCSGRQVRALTFVADRSHEGYEQLPRTGQHLIITKATKDVVVLRRAGYIACAPTSENSLKNIIARMGELSQRFSKVLVLFDPDATGRANASKLMAASNWRWQSAFLPGGYNYAKDPADCVRKHKNHFWLHNFLSTFDLHKYHL